MKLGSQGWGQDRAADPGSCSVQAGRLKACLWLASSSCCRGDQCVSVTWTYWGGRGGKRVRGGGGEGEREGERERERESWGPTLGGMGSERRKVEQDVQGR